MLRVSSDRIWDLWWKFPSLLSSLMCLVNALIHSCVCSAAKRLLSQCSYMAIWIQSPSHGKPYLAQNKLQCSLRGESCALHSHLHILNGPRTFQGPGAGLKPLRKRCMHSALGSTVPLPWETKETPANPSKNFFIAFPSQAHELRDTINVIYGLDQRWTRVLSM